MVSLTETLTALEALCQSLFPCIQNQLAYAGEWSRIFTGVTLMLLGNTGDCISHSCVGG